MLFLQAVPGPTILAMGIVALLTIAAAVQAVMIDRYRASQANQRFYLEAHLARARGLGRHEVRIPAETLAKAFRLDGRTLPNPADFRGKAPKHPALSAPARRRKMGARSET